MHLTTITFLFTLFWATVSAWKVTLYKHPECGGFVGPGESEYYTLSSEYDMEYCNGLPYIGHIAPQNNLLANVTCRLFTLGGRKSAPCKGRGFHTFKSYSITRGQLRTFKEYDSHPNQPRRIRCYGPLDSTLAVWGYGNLETPQYPNHRDHDLTYCRTPGTDMEGFQVKNYH